MAVSDLNCRCAVAWCHGMAHGQPAAPVNSTATRKAAYWLVVSHSISARNTWDAVLERDATAGSAIDLWTPCHQKGKTMRTAVCLALLAVPVIAQQPPEDPMREALFPPEIVMQHQQDLGLSDEQKNYLKTEVRQAQLRFTELQWTLQDEMDRLVSTLKRSKVDEKDAASQLDKVLSAEREIKRAQFTLLIHIKNNLTPAQQSKLREFADKAKGR
jgi:Spy/CpxP family protein refolding chaperone